MNVERNEYCFYGVEGFGNSLGLVPFSGLLYIMIR